MSCGVHPLASRSCSGSPAAYYAKTVTIVWLIGKVTIEIIFCMDNWEQHHECLPGITHSYDSLCGYYKRLEKANYLTEIGEAMECGQGEAMTAGYLPIPSTVAIDNGHKGFIIGLSQSACQIVEWYLTLPLPAGF